MYENKNWNCGERRRWERCRVKDKKRKRKRSMNRRSEFKQKNPKQKKRNWKLHWIKSKSFTRDTEFVVYFH